MPSPSPVAGSPGAAAPDAAVQVTDIRSLALVGPSGAGLASRLELEDTRRSLLQARIQQTDTEREQVAAWIALYRALGGGWQATDPAPALAAAGR